MSVVRAGDEFELLAQNKLDDDFTASPAISQVRIIFRGRNHLYCSGGNQPSLAHSSKDIHEPTPNPATVAAE